MRWGGGGAMVGYILVRVQGGIVWVEFSLFGI